MKWYLGYFLLFSMSFSAFCQSNEVRAKAYFLQAQQYYNDGSYPLALEKLESVKQLLGTSNPKVDYLLTKCYWANDQPLAARQAMASYFKLASDQDPNYSEMLLLLDDVDRQAKLEQAKRDAQARREEMRSEIRKVFCST